MKQLLAAEVPLLLPGAREFFSEGHIHGALNEKHFVAALSKGIESGQMFVFADGCPLRGAIAATMYPDLATGELCCMEYFWFVRKEERGSMGVRLLASFEEEAIARGAARISMMHHVTPESTKFEHIYSRRGYALHEQVFVKQVKA